MKAEDLYDEIRRKLETIPPFEGSVKRVFVDVNVIEAGEGIDLCWNIVVYPAEDNIHGHGIAGQDSWHGNTVARASIDTLHLYDVAKTPREVLLGAIQDYAEEWKSGRSPVGSPAKVALYQALDKYDFAALEKVNVFARELGDLKKKGIVVRERLPDTRESITRKFEIARPGHRNGDLSMYVTVGLYPDGRPGEIFIRADRTGSFASGALDAVAMVLSVAWQYGVPFAPTVAKLRGMRFEPQGATGDPKYGLVKSPLDYVAKWLLDRFVKTEDPGK